MQRDKSTPAPIETDRGDQQDDNIDDLGRRGDGVEVDQPVNPDKSGENDAGEGEHRGN